MRARTESEQHLRSEARQMVRHRNRALAKADHLHAEAAELLDGLNAQVKRESERFGIDLPSDALLLDILELVTVEPDGAWRWSGTTNNKQLPTVRYRNGPTNSERSVTRYLAEAFGLVDPEWEGILYPLNGTQDVNPWHREQREYPKGKARGNAHRYTWDEAS